MGYHIALWSELVLLLLQNTACLALHYRFADPKPEDGGGRSKKTVALLSLGRDLGFLCIAALAMMRLPSRLMSILCLWTVPLALVSYGQQVARTTVRGAMALSPSVFSVLLRWISSAVRVSTTLTFLGRDPFVLANHLIGLIGCSVLLVQLHWYAGPGISRPATRTALYAELFGTTAVDATNPEAATGARSSAGGGAWYNRQLLAWPSLGGLDGTGQEDER